MTRLRNELDKLEEYLIDHRITFESIHKMGWHQICVPESGENCRWDAICHRGSYGYEQGLIEIYGELVTEEDGDSVVGWLTAEDVIRRLEKKNEEENEKRKE